LGQTTEAELHVLTVDEPGRRGIDRRSGEVAT
jgi:hypothetical protein